LKNNPFASDGPLSKRGYRRIIRDSGSTLEGEEWADRAEQLEGIAKEVLGGRSAAVFAARVIDPLMGRPKRGIDELARQFGVAPNQIYKITEKAKERVAVAAKRALDKGEGEEVADVALQKAWKQTCAACGRPWILAWNDVCPSAHCWFFRHR
jgi:hypothetical protein